MIVSIGGQKGEHSDGLAWRSRTLGAPGRLFVALVRPGTGSVDLKHAAPRGMDSTLHLLRSPFHGGSIRQFGMDIQESVLQPAVCKRLEDTDLHACETTDVDQAPFVAQERVKLGQGAIQVVMDVLALATVEAHLSADNRVIGEIRVLLGHLAEEVVIDQIAGVGRAHH